MVVQTEATEAVAVQASGETPAGFNAAEIKMRDSLADALATAGRMVMGSAATHKLVVQAGQTAPLTADIVESVKSYADSVSDLGKWLMTMAATIKAA